MISTTLDPLTLPVEIVIQVLEVIPQKDLLSAMQVSKSWYATVLQLSPLVYSPVFKAGVEMGQFCSYLNMLDAAFMGCKVKQVNSLNLKHCKIRDTLRILSLLSVSSVRTDELKVFLRLNEYFGKLLSRPRTKELFSQLSKLSLHMPELFGTELLDMLMRILNPSMEYLSLTFDKRRSGNILFKSDNTFRKLKVLQLHAVGDTTSRALRKTVTLFHEHNTFPNLVRLSLDKYPVTPETLKGMVSANLKWLQVYGVSTISFDDVIHVLEESIARVKIFEFEGDTRKKTQKEVTLDEDLDLIPLSQVRILKLSKVNFTFDSLIKILDSTNNGIEDLDITGNKTPFDASQYLDIFSCCPNLRAFAFRKWEVFDDDTCQLVSRALASSGAWKRLREIDIRDNEGVTTTGISSFFSWQYPLLIRSLRCDCNLSADFIKLLRKRMTTREG